MAGMGGIDPTVLQQYLQRQQGGITTPGQMVAQGPEVAPQAAPPAATDYASWWNPNDPQGSFQRLTQGKDASSETLQGLAPYLQAIGGRLENPNAAGFTSKVVLPNGQIVRVGNMFDAPGAQKSWGWTVQPNAGAGGMAGPAAGPNQGQNFIDDPSYQFQLGEGLKALQRSAAARGTLLTGGTLKGLQRYAQDYANTAYQNAFGRNLDVARLGLSAAGSLGALGSSYGREAGDLYGQLGNAQAGGTIGKTNPWLGALGGIESGLQDWYGSRRTQGPIDYST